MPFFSRKKKYSDQIIDPDQIFLDASNLPEFDVHQFEGRLERPIKKKTFLFISIFFVIGLFIYIGRVSILEVHRGDAYSLLSEQNRLRNTVIFGDRGVIYDRNKVLLASNIPSAEHPDFSTRKYTDILGLSHLLGFVGYPSKDSSGFYYSHDFIGKDGIEETYNELLGGKNGLKIVETNALGKIQSENIISPPTSGQSVTLSIDSRLQSKLYEFMEGLSKEIGFTGGAGAIMDIENGEILVLTSYPEYNSNILSNGTDSTSIQKYITDSRKPFLNRVTDGLYTPGSIVKPFIALGVLEEKVIDPTKKILSTGSISIPNPYDPTKKSIFTDWRPQGWVDLREALAVSSDVYFYEVGGGFEDQKGLGIEHIEKYMKLFGFGASALGGEYFSGKAGVIPTPLWKKENFKDGLWRIGDTYNTSIGQYGFQSTPIQALLATASVANGGTRIAPTLFLHGENDTRSEAKELPIEKKYFPIVRAGMRDAVLFGTAKGLNIPSVQIGAKTGTAELGTLKKYVNSWVIGFFPYEAPKYAFVAMMEKGPHDNTIGALYVMRQLFDWMALNTPEYLSH